MAELEPGHPDELRDQLANWISQATSPIGSLPTNITPAEWVARNFIDLWREPVRSALDSIEQMIRDATAAIESGDQEAAISTLNGIRQEVAEGLREPLGLYDWNRADSP